ncbi:SOS response-associated peptidase [Luteococcus sp. Sow4_B9]|uniref:SOS response-associated peptidase n=1 Tax=Luteococcus sp. Sow4_B9 TaxID=3438792 RepID=UPI003F99DE7E
MCGRYAASASQDLLVETFEVDEVVELESLPPLAPRYNIAPTDPVPAIVERHDRVTGGVRRKLVRPRWGLVPSWAKDRSRAASLINARSETVDSKPSFRKAFTHRRCLLPADGYYEWYTRPADSGTGRPTKQPYWIHPVAGHDDVPLMVMAGLYEFWRDPALPAEHPDAWLTTCTVITTQASDALGRIHDRMPMQVRRRDWQDWLDPDLNDPLAVHDLLHAPAPDEMTAHPVSPLVGQVRNDSPNLVEPLPDGGDAPTLLA